MTSDIEISIQNLIHFDHLRVYFWPFWGSKSHIFDFLKVLEMF